MKLTNLNNSLLLSFPQMFVEFAHNGRALSLRLLRPDLAFHFVRFFLVDQQSHQTSHLENLILFGSLSFVHVNNIPSVFAQSISSHGDQFFVQVEGLLVHLKLTQLSLALVLLPLSSLIIAV